MKLNQLLTLDQVANITEEDPGDIYTMTLTNQLPHYCCNCEGDYLYKLEDIERYLDRVHYFRRKNMC